MSSDDLVAAGTRTGNGTITLTEQNSSGLTGSVDVTYVSDTTSITYNLKVFKENDEIRFTLSNDRAGLLQTIFGRLWYTSLPSATSGSETIDDGVVREGLNVLVPDHAA
jgi:hypothetical protein